MAGLTLSVDSSQPTDTTRLIFQTVNEALRYVEQHPSDATTINIAPGVYWIDDPNDPAIRRPKPNTTTPFGFEVNISHVTLHGLSSNPEDIVLASQRGQTQGADGNFTMFHFLGTDIKAENITFGNYCNVDLVYPRNPNLNRPRRADAIVQAQLAICNGGDYQFTNCRFISRLNLCPFVGAANAVFKNCYFESTDDALCGTGVYIGCRFTFYSSKPFYTTSHKGAVLMDCDIHSKVQGTQYLTKVPAPAFLIDCRFTSDDPNLQLAWTPIPGRKLRCYQHNITLNGKPITIGGEGSENTVIMSDKLLAHFKNEDGTYTTNNLPKPLRIENDGEQTDTADIEYPQDLYETITTPEGLEAVKHTHIIPRQLPPPALLSPLKIKRKGNTYTAAYQLDLQGHDDTSDLLWFRRYYDETMPDIPVQMGGITFIDQPNEDSRHRMYNISCVLAPKTNRSWIAPSVQLLDLHQPHLLAGAWTWTLMKPDDVKQYNWQPDGDKSPWQWSRGVDGARNSEGLFTTSRGCRLMYTYAYNHTALQRPSLRASLAIDPCKTAGQGFGSATGQYMDIAVMYDNANLSGYSLRIERTPYHDKAVVLTFVEHRRGVTKTITEPIVTQAFKPGCLLNIAYNNVTRKITADISNPQQQVAPTSLSLELNTTADRALLGSGFMLQHTGTLGSGGLVIKSLTLQYNSEPIIDISCFKR